jgi:hypothetical protein
MDRSQAVQYLESELAALNRAIEAIQRLPQPGFSKVDPSAIARLISQISIASRPAE